MREEFEHFVPYSKLVELTGFKTKKKIAEGLNAMGITHRIRPDNFPVVDPRHLNKALGAESEMLHNKTSPNLDCI